MKYILKSLILSITTIITCHIYGEIDYTGNINVIEPIGNNHPGIPMVDHHSSAQPTTVDKYLVIYDNRKNPDGFDFFGTWVSAGLLRAVVVNESNFNKDINAMDRTSDNLNRSNFLDQVLSSNVHADISGFIPTKKIKGIICHKGKKCPSLGEKVNRLIQGYIYISVQPIAPDPKEEKSAAPIPSKTKSTPIEKLSTTEESLPTFGSLTLSDEVMRQLEE
ncbi:MAG: hypothetical protein COZ46_00260 [Verrucomicrobia bacterium CG_4_10_14_3_um_filter_43_23]|nr:MAG: hypothetical protein AUJ82_04680 [Verrucomicrobia bacterium CG1_02_43_26]PIP59012.1 MAG: hypothetical protein COX01_05530 [Verrucomicrobia bacterium CG22_combo_CG10-13_8_21_14_all_43_17]PIX59109.1 MAG: hypothetical protein COZ46_00260 [Verrucomicrobia bacterium CG_4_10_14_3_um_filter_43_23]PIY61369.1 MAG: hypothetical protein COY94_05850 [Verrucomicrobia bacterium CG_4_10_14_0_8_um_filter_43_34]PJA44151.1 MAG: hypothetical protein CO175_04565 [Verrucomicrobia bacterium CG_4_9_14_3_um_fi